MIFPNKGAMQRTNMHTSQHYGLGQMVTLAHIQSADMLIPVQSQSWVEETPRAIARFGFVTETSQFCGPIFGAKTFRRQ
jgi:hypothetical protein